MLSNVVCVVFAVLLSVDEDTELSFTVDAVKLAGCAVGFKVMRLTAKFSLVSLLTCTITPGLNGQRGGDFGICVLPPPPLRTLKVGVLVSTVVVVAIVFVKVVIVVVVVVVVFVLFFIKLYCWVLFALLLLLPLSLTLVLHSLLFVVVVVDVANAVVVDVDNDGEVVANKNFLNVGVCMGVVVVVIDVVFVFVLVLVFVFVSVLVVCAGGVCIIMGVALMLALSLTSPDIAGSNILLIMGTLSVSGNTVLADNTCGI